MGSLKGSEAELSLQSQSVWRPLLFIQDWKQKAQGSSVSLCFPCGLWKIGLNGSRCVAAHMWSRPRPARAYNYVFRYCGLTLSARDYTRAHQASATELDTAVWFYSWEQGGYSMDLRDCGCFAFDVDLWRFKLRVSWQATSSFFHSFRCNNFCLLGTRRKGKVDL